MTDSKFSQSDFDKKSNADKYKMRVAVAYGKDAHPKFYKQGLAYAQGLDAKQYPKKKTHRESLQKHRESERILWDMPEKGTKRQFPAWAYLLMCLVGFWVLFSIQFGEWNT